MVDMFYSPFGRFVLRYLWLTNLSLCNDKATDGTLVARDARVTTEMRFLIRRASIEVSTPTGSLYRLYREVAGCSTQRKAHLAFFVR